MDAWAAAAWWWQPAWAAMRHLAAWQPACGSGGGWLSFMHMQSRASIRPACEAGQRPACVGEVQERHEAIPHTHCLCLGAQHGQAQQGVLRAPVLPPRRRRHAFIRPGRLLLLLEILLCVAARCSHGLLLLRGLLLLLLLLLLLRRGAVLPPPPRRGAVGAPARQPAAAVLQPAARLKAPLFCSRWGGSCRAG